MILARSASTGAHLCRMIVETMTKRGARRGDEISLPGQQKRLSRLAERIAVDSAQDKLSSVQRATIDRLIDQILRWHRLRRLDARKLEYFNDALLAVVEDSLEDDS